MAEELFMLRSPGKITFSWNKSDPDHSYQCKQFCIQVPDEFEIIRDAKHEFYACLKDPDNPEKIRITIKPGRMTTLQTFGMDIHSQELLLAILHLNAMKGMSGLLWIAERSEIFTVRAGEQELLCLYDYGKEQAASFYVYMAFGSTVRPIIFIFDSHDGLTGDDGRRMVGEIVSHLTLKQKPFQSLPALTDPGFTKGILLPQTVSQWKRLRAQYMEEMEHIFYVHLQITQQKIRAAQKKGGTAALLAKNWYREDLEQYALMVEKLLEETAEFLKLVFSANSDNPSFYELAADMEAFLQDNRKVAVSIDHEEKSVPVRNEENVQARWRYCTLRQQIVQISGKRDVLADMDRGLRNDYEGVQQEYKELSRKLESLEHQLNEKQETDRRKRESELAKVNELMREKELELGECYALQKRLKQQIQNISFLHRMQKEGLNRQLSAVVIRTGKIRTEMDNLEDRKSRLEVSEDEELQSLESQIKSYRLRTRMKEEECLKSRKIVERNKKLLAEKQGELEKVQEELDRIARIVNSNND